MDGRKQDTYSAAEFLHRVEFSHAAKLSFITSGIVFPAYKAMKRDFGIARPEYLLLACLAHFPVLTAQDVSRLTGRPRNSISRAVHRMLSEEYLERVPDPHDGRQANLTITAKGRDLHDQVVQYLVMQEREVLRILNKDEMASLHRLLSKVVGHLEALQSASGRAGGLSD